MHPWMSAPLVNRSMWMCWEQICKWAVSIWICAVSSALACCCVFLDMSWVEIVSEASNIDLFLFQMLAACLEACRWAKPEFSGTIPLFYINTMDIKRSTVSQKLQVLEYKDTNNNIHVRIVTSEIFQQRSRGKIEIYLMARDIRFKRNNRKKPHAQHWPIHSKSVNGIQLPSI